MKILQLYYKMPFPMHDGGAYSIYSSSLSLLHQQVDLQILAMDLHTYRGKVSQIPDDFIVKTNFESIVVDNRIKIQYALKNLLGKTSYFVERFYSDAYKTRLANILKHQQFDIIQLEHLYLCLYLPIIQKHSNAKIVLRAQNIESRLWNRYLSKIRNPFTRIFLSIAIKRLDIFERQMTNNVDGIITLSNIDKDYFRQIAQSVKITTIPIGVDFGRFKNIDPDIQYESFPVVYHIGSMDWKPNIQGLKWFFNEVLPLLKTKYPKIQIKIAGKNMPKWFFQHKDVNVFVEGTVEDSVKYQEDKAILIVPLLTGSGIRVKILEALAMSKTIISTTIGAEGIPVTDNENLLIANTPEEFVSQISRCVESKPFCRKIGSNALKLAKDEFDFAKIGDRMIEFYKLLIFNKNQN